MATGLFEQSINATIAHLAHKKAMVAGAFSRLQHQDSSYAHEHLGLVAAYAAAIDALREAKSIWEQGERARAWAALQAGEGRLLVLQGEAGVEEAGPEERRAILAEAFQSDPTAKAAMERIVGGERAPGLEPMEGPQGDGDGPPTISHNQKPILALESCAECATLPLAAEPPKAAGPEKENPYGI